MNPWKRICKLCLVEWVADELDEDSANIVISYCDSCESCCPEDFEGEDEE